MRTRLRGITGVMLLLLGSLLIIAGPAAADTSGDDVVEEKAVLVIEEQPAEEAPAPDTTDDGELSEDDKAAIQEKKDAADAKDEDPVDDGKTDDEEPVAVLVIEETLLDEGPADDVKVDAPTDDELPEDDKAAIQEKKDAADAKDEDPKDEDPKDEAPVEYLEVMVVCEGDYDGEYDNDDQYEIIVEECDEPDIMVVCEDDYQGEYDNDGEYEIIVEECDEPEIMVVCEDDYQGDYDDIGDYLIIVEECEPEFDPCEQAPRFNDDIRVLAQDCEPQKELVAICHVEHGAAFSYNVLQHVSEKDATWHLENHEDDSKVYQRGDCKPPKDVTVCQLAGLDYKLWTGHPADANWMIANDGAVLTDGGSCPIRVCHFENTETFSYWKTIYANQADASWYVEAYEKDSWAIPGKPCPGNDDVEICHLVDGKYKLLQVTPDVGNWFLSLDNDDTVPNDDGKCPEVPKPEPTPDPTPDPTPEPTPDPTPEPTPKDDGDDDGTGGETTEPEVTDEPAEEEEEKKVVAPKPKDDDDSEVLAKTVTKETTEKAEELALTGTESGQLAMYGLALIAGGLMLMGTSRLRRITI